MVVGLSTTSNATTIRFDDGDGGVVGVRLASLFSGPFVPALAEGDAVHVSLIRREGFEGVANGLVVRDLVGDLLLLYDDGGYGPAFYQDGERAGIGVDRSLLGTTSGDEWASRPVRFRLAGESATGAEGEWVSFGETRLAATVVVSREWTGEPMTDIDLSPLAYLVLRTQ